MPTFREKILELSGLPQGQYTVREHLLAIEAGGSQEIIVKNVQRGGATNVPNVMLRSNSKADIEQALNQALRGVTNQIRNVRDGV